MHPPYAGIKSDCLHPKVAVVIRLEALVSSLGKRYCCVATTKPECATVPFVDTVFLTLNHPVRDRGSARYSVLDVQFARVPSRLRCCSGSEQNPAAHCLTLPCVNSPEHSTPSIATTAYLPAQFNRTTAEQPHTVGLASTVRQS